MYTEDQLIELNKLIHVTVMNKPIGEVIYSESESGHINQGVEEYDIPNYTTSISAAWEVVEEMGHIGLMWEPFVLSKTVVTFDRVETSAPTAPLAISLAALKAKDIDVDKELNIG